jgi:hypothetical protein
LWGIPPDPHPLPNLHSEKEKLPAGLVNLVSLLMYGSYFQLQKSPPTGRFGVVTDQCYYGPSAIRLREHCGMGRNKKGRLKISRRTFLERMRCTPMLFLPSPLHSSALRWNLIGDVGRGPDSFRLADFHYHPQYPKKSPLDDILRYIAPGTDEFLTEKYAAEIGQRLEQWSKELRANPSELKVLAASLDPSFQATSIVPLSEKIRRSEYGIEVLPRTLAAEKTLNGQQFLEQIRAYLAAFELVETAEFQITVIEEPSRTPLSVHSKIRYELVGARSDARREELIGYWAIDWSHDDSAGWRILHWNATDETVSRAPLNAFADVTEQALGNIESYKTQLIPGTDDWRTLLDEACGVDVYDNTGVAAGDYNNDGFDDLYICRPPGLPNRLYRNRGDKLGGSLCAAE